MQVRGYSGCRASVIRIASSTAANSSGLNLSILDCNRDLSKDRIWSPKTRAGVPFTRTRASPGYSESTLLVSGNTTTREPKVLHELFETITAGLVFLISDPNGRIQSNPVNVFATEEVSSLWPRGTVQAFPVIAQFFSPALFPGSLIRGIKRVRVRMKFCLNSGRNKHTQLFRRNCLFEPSVHIVIHCNVQPYCHRSSRRE